MTTGPPSVELAPSRNDPRTKPARSARSIHDEEALGRALDFQLIRRLLPFVKPHGRALTASMLLLPVTAVLVTSRPRIMRWALDQGVLRHDLHVVDRAALLYFGVVALEYACRFAQVYAMQIAGARAMADLRMHVFHFLQQAKLGFFDNQPVGRLVTRVTNDIDALGELFASGALNAVGDLLSVLLILGMMFSLDVRLALIAMATLPPLAVTVNAMRSRARAAFRDIRARTARLNSYMGEQVQGVAVTQAYGREEACQREFDLENAAYRDANYKAIFYDSFLDALVEGVSILCVAVLLWFVGIRGVRLGMAVVSFGTFVAFMQYVEQFFVPIRDISSRYTILQSAMAGAERVFRLLDTPGIADAPPARTAETPSAPTEDSPPLDPAPFGDSSLAVEMDHVDFSYRPDSPVLQGVSFVATQGERIALVGATGAGKTTIASLLLRLYERDAGVIRVFGRDVRAYDRTELRKLFAVVPQDVYLFAGTIASNIAIGSANDEADGVSGGMTVRARVERALRRIDALDFFLRRPGGLDASIGERGGGLSTGERQLVAFARALYRDPPILVLDEATANVDSETERHLQTALHAVLEGRTSIIIAHRLSTIRTADRVVVMHRGHVAETGTHEQLLAQGGLYAKLHRLQFARDGGEAPTNEAGPVAAQ